MFIVTRHTKNSSLCDLEMGLFKIVFRAQKMCFTFTHMVLIHLFHVALWQTPPMEKWKGCVLGDGEGWQHMSPYCPPLMHLLEALPFRIGNQGERKSSQGQVYWMWWCALISTCWSMWLPRNFLKINATTCECALDMDTW